MKLKIKYFGQIAELTSKSDEERILAASTSITGLRTALESFYPDLNQVEYKVAVDQSLVGDDWIIDEDSEVAILPPFAGG